MINTRKDNSNRVQCAIDQQPNELRITHTHTRFSFHPFYFSPHSASFLIVLFTFRWNGLFDELWISDAITPNHSTSHSDVLFWGKSIENSRTSWTTNGSCRLCCTTSNTPDPIPTVHSRSNGCRCFSFQAMWIENQTRAHRLHKCWIVFFL